LAEKFLDAKDKAIDLNRAKVEEELNLKALFGD